MVNAPDTSSVDCTGILIEVVKRVTFVDVGMEKEAASTADFAINVPTSRASILLSSAMSFW